LENAAKNKVKGNPVKGLERSLNSILRAVGSIEGF
jgi:hypothetical protein